MNAAPLVSVVVPCLNRAEYLAPTLESILAQDYPRIECVVVDGGSTDGTLDILGRYDGRIRWISEPDRGHADAINKGFRLTRGEIVTWLNADDLWAVPHAVREAAEYLRLHPDVDVVYGKCGAIDSEGRLVGMCHWRPWSLEYAVEHCDHCIPQPASFIRRRALERVGGLDPRVYKKDHDLWLRIALRGRIESVRPIWGFARNIRGISFNGTRVGPACLQITRRVLDHPLAPPRIVHRRRRAMSNAYLKASEYAFDGGPCWRQILWYWAGALLADPSNLTSVSKQAVAILRNAPASVTLLRREPGVVHFLRRGMGVLGRWVRRVRRAASRPRIPNLLGDRDLEWSWMAAHLPDPPGEALDFGSGDSPLALTAALRGFSVTAVDLTPPRWSTTHAAVRVLVGDILDLPLARDRFDLVINCSTTEHVGLAGRYGVTEHRPDGDLEAMERLRTLMKPGARMLLSVPVGRDTVFAPLHRVYGRARLPRLVAGFRVEKEEFWVKDRENRWAPAERDAALDFPADAGSNDPLCNIYALGCFVLKRPDA